jgi:hypothetical protein
MSSLLMVQFPTVIDIGGKERPMLLRKLSKLSEWSCAVSNQRTDDGRGGEESVLG